MIKVGIVCCHDVKNYGSRLQIYALQRVLQDIMHTDAEIVNYVYSKDARSKVKKIIMLPFNIFHRQWWVGKLNKQSLAINETALHRNVVLEEFKKSRFKLSSQINTYRDLKNCVGKYDIILCGSDQIWHPDCIYNPYYMLEFSKKANKTIAYASSIGVDKIERHFVPWYKYYLRYLSCITMREEQGATILSKYLKKDIDVVLDPVALLTKNEWMDIESQATIDTVKYGRYVLCYFLGINEKHRRFAENYAQANSLKLVSLPYLKQVNEADALLSGEKLIDVKPEDLLKLINNATMVITDSFHVSLFSIIFEKQFITMERFSNSHMSSNSRIYNLFSKLEINNAIYSGDEDVYGGVDSIEYSDKLREKLRTEKERSLDILRSMLRT